MDEFTLVVVVVVVVFVCMEGFCGIEEKKEKREEGEISVDAAMRCAGGMNRKSRGKEERERERDREGGVGCNTVRSSR